MDEPKTATETVMLETAAEDMMQWHMRFQNFLKEYQAREDARTLAMMACRISLDHPSILTIRESVPVALDVLKEARALIEKDGADD